MTFVTRSVRLPAILLFVLAAQIFSIVGFAQSFPYCTPGATNLTNHAEGIAEPSGDIVLSCVNGAPGSTIISNIIVQYNVQVTNRLVNGAPDAAVTVDTGSGPVVSNVTPILSAANGLAFNGVTFVVPTSGAVQIRITNVRVNADYLGSSHSPVLANLSTTSLSLSTPLVTVATPTTGLLATYSSTGITCTGSPLPASVTFANLLALGTNFASTRVTEGFANAFAVKDATSDIGTRIRLHYTDVPSTAHIFVPDYVTGNDAQVPTAAGDIGGALVSPGQYVQGSGTLLLARVINADSTGAGGFVVGTPGSFTPGTMTEVPFTAGDGSAVYEVIDANNSAQENAQIPTFIGIPTNQPPAVATEMVSLAPFNTSPVAGGGPVPRFAAPGPPSDCSVVGDCGANYFPVLSATSTGLQFSVSPSGNFLTQFIQVNNTSGGTLQFSTSVTYQGTAQGWLSVTNQSGNSNHTTLRVDAQPIGLAPGTYQATVTINAGAAGTQAFPVKFTIGQGQVTISSIVNAASFQAGALVAGSLATIKGTNLGGKVVGVTFNNVSGSVLYDGGSQINVQVPSSLASATSAQVVATIDGNSSAPFNVTLASVNPGIFGVLNQDSSLNSPSNPAAGGSVIQIFVTGLIGAVSSGPVVVGLGNQGIPTLYSGAGANGVQQVNAQLPSNAASIPGLLTVCGTDINSQLVCSPVIAIYTK